MADMAAIDQVEECWDELVEAGVADRTVPVTYMNSSAAIKAFTGRHGGTICTSSNAKTALTWALDRAGDGGKVLFLPDQHLGRNTYVRDLGRPLDDCVVWDPHRPMGGLTAEQLRDATMILWRGHCSVHGRFSVEAVEAARRDIPDVKVIVHPECRHEVVELADEVGSTEKIIATIAAAPRRHRVGRRHRAQPRAAAGRTQFPEQRIVFLEKNVCYCSTMNRIDLPHLVWALESLVDGPGGQPDPGRRRGGRAGAGRPRPDARAARRDPARTDRRPPTVATVAGGPPPPSAGCARLLLGGRPGAERLGRGLVPEALEPGVGRAARAASPARGSRRSR